MRRGVGVGVGVGCNWARRGVAWCGEQGPRYDKKVLLSIFEYS